MKGAVRPCENPTINTAILLSDYALAQGMCLYLLRSGFSVGLHRAKITEVRAKGLAPLGFASEPLACPQAPLCLFPSFSRLR